MRECLFRATPKGNNSKIERERGYEGGCAVVGEEWGYGFVNKRLVVLLVAVSLCRETMKPLIMMTVCFLFVLARFVLIAFACFVPYINIPVHLG